MPSQSTPIFTLFFSLGTRLISLSFSIPNTFYYAVFSCFFLAFTVEKIDGIHVSIHGLGPLNWIVRRVLRALLRRHLREYLEREGRDVVQQELQNATVASEGDNLFTMLPQLVMY